MKIRISASRIFMTVYVFFIVFVPPLTKIYPVYLTGFFALLFWFKDSALRVSLNILKSSGIYDYFTVMKYCFLYVLFSCFIHLFIPESEFFINDFLHTTNQFILLTGIELFEVYYLICYAEKKGYGYTEIIKSVTYAGALQGICSVLAFSLPKVRQFFLMNHEGAFKALWTLERRGYGYSAMLLDLFGYGLGLIAGVVVLTDRLTFKQKTIVFPLVLISIILNSRTGIAILLVALAIYMFKLNKLKEFIFKSIIIFPLLLVAYFDIVPLLLIWLKRTSYHNLQWVADGLTYMYNPMQYNNASGKTPLAISPIIPSNLFDLLFGEGHTVYGLGKGHAHSDTGYINYLWLLGAIGLVIFLVSIVSIIFSAYNRNEEKERYVILFIALAFLTGLVKGRVIGYNAGIVVTYIVVFSTRYFLKHKHSACFNHKK